MQRGNKQWSLTKKILRKRGLEMIGGYPHRRHHSSGKKTNPSKKLIIDNIIKKEFCNIIKTKNYV